MQIKNLLQIDSTPFTLPPMPRKPTEMARIARARIIEMARSLDTSLPTLRELSDALDLHPSTIFRLLRDLVAEGVVWQSPTGRFYPASARKHRVRGVPIYFIGREMWHWSRLYQEILEGVSEVCSANESPLILLSAPSLVRQVDPHLLPVFASAERQKKELMSLLPSVARTCGGILLDHLWCEGALSLLGIMGTPKLQLLHGAGRKTPVVAPDAAWSARCVREFMLNQQVDEINLVVPFRGDKAIDAALTSLRSALEGLPFREVTFAEINGKLSSLVKKKTTVRRCIICAEDNTANSLLHQLNTLEGLSDKIMLFGTQGTGLLSAPACRLRIDYRRLGRTAASFLLHGTPAPLIRASLVYTSPSG